MDVSKLIRDPDRIFNLLVEREDGSVVTSKELKIYVPTRYKDKNLAYVGSENSILGVLAITFEDKYYGVMLVNAMMPIAPTTTNKVKVGEDEYFEFVFIAGSVVFKSLNLVKINTISYLIFDEMLSKGYVPWYIKYEEIGMLFDTALKHAGADVGSNHEVTRLIASIVARDPSDRTRYYRTKIQNYSDLVTDPPVFIPLRSVQYSATNTLNKIGGSYMSEGIVSALIDPATRVERIEELLRQ